MKEELTKQLLEKYPKLYADYYKPMNETCMCWGFEHGDGWYNLIDELSKELTEISEKHNIQIIADQVKEKYGGLRFYFSISGECEKAIEDLVYTAVRKAEEKADITCEECGADGAQLNHRSYWYKTLCPKCAQPLEYKPVK